MASIFRKISAFGDRHPVLKNVFNSGLITGSGDAVCQLIESHFAAKSKAEAEGREPLSFAEHLIKGDYTMDRRRVFAVALFGYCFLGPVGSVWYPGVHKFVCERYPTLPHTSMRFVFTKVFLEQIFFGPVYAAAFFPFVNFAEGKDFNALIAKLRADYLQTLIVDEACWLVASPFIYRFVSVPRQLLVVSMLAAVESMFFSYVAHNGFPKTGIDALDKVGALLAKSHGSDGDAASSSGDKPTSSTGPASPEGVDSLPPPPSPASIDAQSSAMDAIHNASTILTSSPSYQHVASLFTSSPSAVSSSSLNSSASSLVSSSPSTINVRTFTVPCPDTKATYSTLASTLYVKVAHANAERTAAIIGAGADIAQQAKMVQCKQDEIFKLKM